MTKRQRDRAKPRKAHARSAKVQSADHRATKKRRLDADKSDRPRRIGPGLDLVDDFAALRVIHSNGGNTAALRQMEVYEWIGDAVIGELVARCLLSQFHHSPLSARVFRNLRLGTVTNDNLATVFDVLGYHRHSFESRRRRTKEKADVVEAVVGEIVVRLELQQRDARVCASLRRHLDEVLAAMLNRHFGERRRVHQKAVLAGPLTASFNAFGCLPQEELDEETGELIVVAGTATRMDESGGDEDAEAVAQQKSFADLLEECEYDDKPRVGVSIEAFQSLADPSTSVTTAQGYDAGLGALDEATAKSVADISKRVALKLRMLQADHVLRTSREIFDVFKIYGMTVLAERVSLRLAFPRLALGRKSDAPTPISPSRLTTERQAVLNMANMERCARFLSLINVDGDSSDASNDHNMMMRRRANTLRAFVGFYSAIAAEDGTQSLADDVAFLLQLLAAHDTDSPVSVSSHWLTTPRREPLVVLTGSVHETIQFMASQVCADLHHHGERPQPTPVPKLLLRKADSNDVEDLFETLARKRKASEEQLTSTSSETNRRRKRKRSEDETASKSNLSKPSANLLRFTHRRFLFCLEEVVILFAQRKTGECRAKIAAFELDLEPCSGTFFRKWEVDTSTLTLAMADSFFRMLLHDLCGFHALVSSSKNTRDGTRITQLRLPLHYSWSKIQRRVTNEEEATG